MHPFRGEQLTIHQARFKEQGFASTVWDSSIVLAKYLEKNAARYAAARCLDLSAGCGLPGIVLAKLGAKVTATDLGPNLVLLEKNAKANGGLVCRQAGRQSGRACGAVRADLNLLSCAANHSSAGWKGCFWSSSQRWCCPPPPHPCSPEPRGQGAHLGRRRGSACAALCGGVRLRRDVHLRGRGAAGGVAGGVVGAWHGSPHSARQESAGGASWLLAGLLV